MYFYYDIVWASLTIHCTVYALNIVENYEDIGQLLLIAKLLCNTWAGFVTDVACLHACMIHRF